jgi:hypothetical protein
MLHCAEIAHLSEYESVRTLFTCYDGFYTTLPTLSATYLRLSSFPTNHRHFRLLSKVVPRIASLDLYFLQPNSDRLSSSGLQECRCCLFLYFMFYTYLSAMHIVSKVMSMCF